MIHNVPIVTLDEYLRLDEQSEWKHEFVDGEVIQMTGASTNHQLIVTNLIAAIFRHTNGRDCSTFPGIKVHVEILNSVYYPDVVVRCGKPLDNVHLITDPVLIVEVLSGSTALIDRREKRAAFRVTPSIREYVIVDQYRRRVEMWRKRDAPTWTEHHALIGAGELTLNSLSCGQLVIPLQDIYAGTNTPSEGSLEVREDAEQYYFAHGIEAPR